jgi:hypothetical protein
MPPPPDSNAARLAAEWPRIRAAVLLSAAKFLDKDAELEDLCQDVFLSFLANDIPWDVTPEEAARRVFANIKGRRMNQLRHTTMAREKKTRIAAEAAKHTPTPLDLLTDKKGAARDIVIAGLRAAFDESTLERKVLEKILGGVGDLKVISDQLGVTHTKVKHARAKLVEAGGDFATEKGLRRVTLAEDEDAPLSEEEEKTLDAALAKPVDTLVRELADSGVDFEARERALEDARVAERERKAAANRRAKRILIAIAIVVLCTGAFACSRCF